MINIELQPGQPSAVVTFRLQEQETGGGPVAVVGDFNDWDPTTHPLVPAEDRPGVLEVVMLIPVGRYGFRYLGQGGAWFNDDEAHGPDGGDGPNSVLDLTGAQARSPAASGASLPGINEPVEPGP